MTEIYHLPMPEEVRVVYREGSTAEQGQPQQQQAADE
jgi:hypothetical protein